MSDSRRLFLGLALPDDTRAALDDALVEVAHIAPRARLTRADNLHLTLLFLGDQPEGALPAIEHALRQAASATPAFDLEVQGAGTFGGRRPRVLFAGIAGAVREASALAAALAEITGHPLDRPWRGHVTLARSRARGGDIALGKAAIALQLWAFGALPARELVLFESRSGPGGVRYLPLCGESLRIRD